jgi:hypothetical protein
MNISQTFIDRPIATIYRPALQARDGRKRMSASATAGHA